MSRLRPQRHDTPRGQVVVIFALLLVVMVAMLGLVLDGGSAYAQRRIQQNASDLAALAGANTYLLTNDATAAEDAALQVAADNGWTDGAGATNVTVTIDTSNGASVTVVVDAPHHNDFGSIVGFSNWQVDTTATALTGFPDTAVGAAPMIFSVDAFASDGTPLPQYGNALIPYPFGEGNGDVPNAPGDLAWTNYGTGNVNTNQVRQIINGSLVITKTLDFGEYIGQHNNGNHTALFSDVNDYLSGTDVPVPVVDHNGNFQGWAMFHVVSASGGSSKHVVGYFKSSFQSALLSVGDCQAGACPRYFGSYVLKLVD